MSKSQSPEKISSQMDSKEMREIRKKIKKAEGELRNDVILDGLQKFDKFDSKQQKQFLRTACKQLKGISWDSVKDKPLAEIKGLVEKTLEQRIVKKQNQLQQIAPKTRSYGMQNQHTEQLTLSELKKSDEIINQTNDNLVNVLQDPLSSPTLTEKEKGDFEKLKKMVQAHEDISLFKDTQEMLSTVPGVKKYFSDFLKELQDHRGLKDNPRYKEGYHYISDEGMLNHIIIPTLKICEQLPNKMKTDEQVLPIIQEIRKECIKYV